MVLVACRPAPDRHSVLDASPSAPAAAIALEASAPLPAAIATPPDWTVLDVRSPLPYEAPDASVPVSTELEEIEDHRQDPQPWARARMANATSGVPELVRLPLRRQGPGWGCTCPPYYVGTYDGANPGTIWLDPVFEPTAVEVAPRETMIAEGYFTGASHVDDGDEKYKVLGFRVLRDRAPAPVPGESPGTVGDTEARALVLARGDPCGRETRPPPDGRTYLLVEASLAMAGPRAYEGARARAEKLRGRFPRVEVLDSRSVPGLFCCNFVVVIDRERSEREATTSAAAAKRMGITAAVRRGW